MTEQREVDPKVGTRVRMKVTNRTGTIQEVLEVDGRTLYGIIYDRTHQDETAPLVYETAGGFDVLPS